MEQADNMGVLKIFRLDSAKDTKPRYDVYEVPYEGVSVLQVLQYVYEYQDATLAFRYGCCGSGPAKCGACVMEVNKRPVLACRMQAEKDMVVKPHPKYRVIKDLVVDFGAEA